jgi:hypothetical protein
MDPADFSGELIGVTIAMLMLAWLLWTVGRTRMERLFATRGRGSTGRVLAVGSYGDGLGYTSCWVEVEYNYDGVLFRAKASVSYREHKRYQVGQRVGLTYVANRPKIIKLNPPEWPLPRTSRPDPATSRPGSTQ